MFGDGVEQTCKPSMCMVQCYFCGGTNNFKIISREIDSIHSRTGFRDMHMVARQKVNFLAELVYICFVRVKYV